MRGFRDRVSVEDALAVALTPLAEPRVERARVGDASGRVLAVDVVSAVDVPAFRRSAMDGWAVVAADTFGASLYDPARLRVGGESMPGGAGGVGVESGSACRIMTGAPVPDGADAVLPAELGEERDGVLSVHDAVPPGKHVGRVGEDVRAGDALFAAGRRLRPQDLGLLASVGVGAIDVIARPRVRIVVSGNELLAPGERPDGHRIVDSNTPMLAALVARDGGEVVEAVRLRDDRELIRAALAKPGADVILTAGGTSVGREDHNPLLVAELGRLEVHGVTMRPSSPTGIGAIGAARVVLLPGNPVSCLAAYDVFAGPVIRVRGGRPAASPYPVVRRRLAGRIVSQIGRTDYCRVLLEEDGTVAPLAVSGASVLSSTTRADGFVLVPHGSEGLAAGADVDVHLYDAEAPR